MPIRSRENLIGAYAFLAGVILAVLVGIFAAAGVVGSKTNPIILGVLALLGIILGYFVAEKNVQTFLFASVSLVIVSFAGIQGLLLDAAIRGIEIGRIVSSILGALLVLFVPSTIVVALKTVFSLAQR
jgi:uncharacterized membrane protein (UPF0136 family)